MRKVKTFLLVIFLILSGAILCAEEGKAMASSDQIKLPPPARKGTMSVEEALSIRRTVRSFSRTSLTLSDLSQLLWAAQGINDEKFKHRTAPSAGALYPLNLYIIVPEWGIKGLKPGLYEYHPNGHYIKMKRSGDLIPELSKVGYSQTFIAEAPVCFIITSVYKRTTWKYGNRGIRYTDMEAGHAAQNIYLQAAALDLGVGIAGAFKDDSVSRLLQIKEDETPLYIVPVGKKK